jgi:hypothetical protein
MEVRTLDHLGTASPAENRQSVIGYNRNRKHTVIHKTPPLVRHPATRPGEKRFDSQPELLACRINYLPLPFAALRAAQISLCVESLIEGTPDF